MQHLKKHYLAYLLVLNLVFLGFLNYLIEAQNNRVLVLEKRVDVIEKATVAHQQYLLVICTLLKNNSANVCELK